MGKGGSKMLKKRWLSFVIMITFVFTVFAGVTVLAEQTENSNVFVITRLISMMPVNYILVILQMVN